MTIQFQYEGSQGLFGQLYALTMPLPKTPALATLCDNLRRDENGNVILRMCYGKEGMRRAFWHFKDYIEENPVSKDEIERVMGAVLATFDHMQRTDDGSDWIYPEDGSEPYPPEPSEEKVKWMQTVFREMVETCMDVLLGANDLEEEQSRADRTPCGQPGCDCHLDGLGLEAMKRLEEEREGALS